MYKSMGGNKLEIKLTNFLFHFGGLHIAEQSKK